MPEDMYCRFEAFVKANAMINPEDEIIAGVSGGADSVCLLLLLKRFCRENGGLLSAVHVNHMIRGEAADEDEAFVKRLCEKLEISCRTERVNVPELAKRRHLSEEEAGRDARYQILLQTAKEKNGKITVAHHLNDNAETILLNLVRGSNLRGLTGMKAVSSRNGVTVLRPLLPFDRPMIEAYLESRNVSWRTDLTNTDPEYARNRMRLRILPELAEINRRAAEHICRAAESFRETEAYLEKETERRFSGTASIKNGAAVLSVAKLKEMDPLFSKRVIYKAIGLAAEAEKDITSDHVESVFHLMFLQSGRQVSLPYGLTAIRQYEEILIRKKEEIPEEEPFPEVSFHKEELSEGEKTLPLPGGRMMRFRLVTVNCENYSCLIEKNTYTKAFDYDKIVGVIKVGEKVPGDQIILKSGTKTVKKLFIDEKIPLAQRQKTILVKDDKHVIWITGSRISEAHKISEQTKKALVISITGGRNGCEN